MCVWLSEALPSGFAQRLLCCRLLGLAVQIQRLGGGANLNYSSSVYHCIILSTQFVGVMLWSMAQLRRGQFRMVVDVLGSCWCCDQPSALARHTHMLHCSPVPPCSWMLCTDRPQFAVCLESSSDSDYIDNTQSLKFDCGEAQTMADIICCRLHDELCTPDELINIIERARACVRKWDHIM